MTINRILKMLITSKNYIVERVKINDEVINFIREVFPSQYKYIAEKEKNYQVEIKYLKQFFIEQEQIY